jgi:hypothetical protein
LFGNWGVKNLNHTGVCFSLFSCHFPKQNHAVSRLFMRSDPRAFSSEVDTGSREENAKKQKDRAFLVKIEPPEMLYIDVLTQFQTRNRFPLSQELL